MQYYGLLIPGNQLETTIQKYFTQQNAYICMKDQDTLSYRFTKPTLKSEMV